MKTQNHKMLLLNEELMRSNYWKALCLKMDWISEKGPSANIPHLAL